jgi:hypothetical protein
MTSHDHDRPTDDLNQGDQGESLYFFNPRRFSLDLSNEIMDTIGTHRKKHGLKRGVSGA